MVDRRRRGDRRRRWVRRTWSLNWIVAGNPARPICRRFPDEVVARLLALLSLDRPEQRIRRAVPLLQSPGIRGFLDAAEQGTV